MGLLPFCYFYIQFNLKDNGEEEKEETTTRSTLRNRS